jgi:hypothetical protein
MDWRNLETSSRNAAARGRNAARPRFSIMEESPKNKTAGAISLWAPAVVLCFIQVL